MPAYSRPGTYVNITQAPIATNAGSIPGQPVACFVADYNAGPTLPTFVTSWNQFTLLYGGFTTGSSSYLPFAVYQYFANGGTGCYILRCPNTDAVQAALSLANVAGDTVEAPTAAPTVTPSTGSGTTVAGTYRVAVTYTDSSGETLPSPITTVTLSATGELTVTSPPTQTGTTGYYVYVSAPGGSTLYRQQTAGSPTTVGTSFVLSVPVSTTGATMPTESTAAGVSMIISALNPGAFGNTIYVNITPTSGANTTLFNLQVYQGGTSPSYLVESWNGISLNPSSNRYAPGLVNSTLAGSSYIRLSGYPTAANYTSGVSDPYTTSAPIALNTAPGASQPAVVNDTPGSDGSTAMNIFDVLSGTSVPDVAWNQGTLATLNDQMLNLNLPDANNSGASGTVNYTLLNEVIAWAESVGNVFVVIDGPFGGGNLSSAGVAALYTNMTQGTSGSIVNSASVAAIYGPWLSIADPSSSASGATVWLPPGGAILGVWCQNDINYTVAQTPAGITATVVASQLEAYFSPTDLSNLESGQINPIRLISGSGFCIFGALTTAAAYPSRYINISRALMKVAHDVIYLTNFAIFQNNTPTLWNDLATVLTNYLVQEMQAGLLAGSTPSTAFQVVCDDTVNTPATIQAGIVNASVAVALASPAEFVVINLSQMASGATTTVSS
jgi:uncharacterized protein